MKRMPVGYSPEKLLGMLDEAKKGSKAPGVYDINRGEVMSLGISLQKAGEEIRKLHPQMGVQILGDDLRVVDSKINPSMHQKALGSSANMISPGVSYYPNGREFGGVIPDRYGKMRGMGADLHSSGDWTLVNDEAKTWQSGKPGKDAMSAKPVPTVDQESSGTLVFSGEKLKLFGKDGKLISMAPAYSGRAGSAKADTGSDTGPIPEGTYYINSDDIEHRVFPGVERVERKNTFGVLENKLERDWGDRILPIKTDKLDEFRKTYPNRDGTKFSIHGGRDVGSSGCIDLGHREKEFLDKLRNEGKGKVKLVVDYSGWNGKVPFPKQRWPK